MNISFVIISFKSFHLLEKIIENIPEKNEIIIIENSLDNNLKDKIEKLYNNVEVIIPEENLGYGRGLNLGVANSKNKNVMCMAADVSLKKECIIEISNILNTFHEFSILTPTYFDESVHKNYAINQNNGIKPIKILNNTLREVDDIDGAIMIINKEKFISKEIFDENIFLYFENTDLCLRVKKNNEKIYVIENLKFTHYGIKSSHPSFQNEVLKSRSWHYCWSKFYFYKKHFNYFFAFRKTLPNLIKAIKYCVFYKIKKDDLRFQLHKNELLGLLNAYFFKKSSYRLNVK
ncbi:MAG: glycosyltransferase family 2 protein [Pelagibacteraceae bacterium]|nr:glycosyltransferase family 2 protein [Pelagibacteraceae bacterium]